MASCPLLLKTHQCLSIHERSSSSQILNMACKTLFQLASAFLSRFFFFWHPSLPHSMVQTYRLSFGSLMSQDSPY